MRLPRTTIGRWMVAVSAVAVLSGLIVGANRLSRRHEVFAYRVRWHSGIVAILKAKRAAAPNDPDDPAILRLIAHYEAMLRKYERAARYPWLPVERDPPEPEEDPALIP